MMEKDFKRAQRLNEVYKYLYAYCGIESKTKLADTLKIQRSGLSAAFGGAKANLTDNLFNRICATFPGIFNLDYLLTGNGELTTGNEEKRNDHGGKDRDIDMSSVINSIIAAKDETISSLKNQMQRDEEVIESLRSQIERLETMLNQKDEIIAMLRQTDETALPAYSYPIGVSDGKTNKNTRK